MTRNARGRFHLLTQFVWPDDAPTGIYAEHVADALIARGCDARLVAGIGSYRSTLRTRPVAPIERLPHYVGRRGDLVRVFAEYASVTLAFRRYILRSVRPGDTVVVVSAPGDTVWLSRAIHARGARAVYWLQDYYPELVRSLWEGHAVVRRAFCSAWDALLGRWDLVVKAAGNLAYAGANATVIRNWPTVDLGPPSDAVPRTALYSGNLGYIHDVDAFVRVCESLRRDGYAITVRADGPGVEKLPSWIHRAPLFADRASLARSYWESEVHLIAGHRRIEHAVFPSKSWNSIASGHRIVTSGFGPAMERELAASIASDYRTHLATWVDALVRTEVAVGE